MTHVLALTVAPTVSCRAWQVTSAPSPPFGPTTSTPPWSISTHRTTRKSGWDAGAHSSAWPLAGPPTESAWAELREAQLLTAKQLPGTGLAVTIDVGDPKDVHPHRKAEVGERLALWALGTTYHKSIVYSGPLYESVAVEGNTIRVRFTNIGSGLEAKGGAMRGFAIAGADRKFHWASASIEGGTVVVSSSEVAAPVAVRYAWSDSPECNLLNVEGLPASPFRSDRWHSGAANTQ